MISQLPSSDRPREKMWERGVEALTDSEVLAVLLRTGTRGKSAVDLGREIMFSCKSDVSRLPQLSMEEWCRIDGIGPTKAGIIMAALELGKRTRQHSLSGRRISSPELVVSYFQEELGMACVENFVAVFLNAKNEVVDWETISIGSLNASIVHPREVFNRAIRRSAAAIVVLHNHPSGHPEPSSEDRAITERLSESGALVGIPLLDHIIIGKTAYYSFKQEGLL